MPAALMIGTNALWLFDGLLSSMAASVTLPAIIPEPGSVAILGGVIAASGCAPKNIRMICALSARGRADNLTDISGRL